MRLLQSTGPVSSVYQGLAVEEWLLDAPLDEGPSLTLWQGPPAVVMGKNQNPWREVNLSQLLQEGIPLARRISGGGTVYHDPGNLNISWVLPRDGYRPERITSLLQRTLNHFGFEALPGVSGGLRIEGKKVSGAAFCYRKERVLHHGTLLLSADLNRLRRVLAPPRLQVETHAVRSIPAAVTNLLDLQPDLTVNDLVQALRWETEQEWGPLSETEFPEPSFIQNRIAAHQTDAWLWEQTPGFQFETPDDLTPHLKAKVRRGMVSEWTVNGISRSDIPPTPFRFSSLAVWSGEMDLPQEALETALVAGGILLP